MNLFNESLRYPEIFKIGYCTQMRKYDIFCKFLFTYLLPTSKIEMGLQNAVHCLHFWMALVGKKVQISYHV